MLGITASISVFLFGKVVKRDFKEPSALTFAGLPWPKEKYVKKDKHISMWFKREIGRERQKNRNINMDVS